MMENIHSEMKELFDALFKMSYIQKKAVWSLK